MLFAHTLGNVRSFAVLFVFAATALVAAEPKVTFDMPFVLEARDVTPQAFAEVHQYEKLMEVRVPVSSLIAAGDESDLTQLVYRLEGPAGRFQVADYLPKTTLETKFASNVLIDASNEHSADLHVDLAGHYQWLTGFTAKADLVDKSSSHVKAELLPPLEAVAASGTTQRQRGVYFKLRGTDRTWLEGSREFAVILRVPREWRADYVLVRCEAEGIRRGVIPSLDEKIVAGRRDFFVALHAAGDEPARAAATALVRAETDLRRAYAKIEADRKKNPNTMFSFNSRREPKIPTDWMPRLVQLGVSTTEVHERLPEELKGAAAGFILARKRLSDLPAGGPVHVAAKQAWAQQQQVIPLSVAPQAPTTTQPLPPRAPRPMLTPPGPSVQQSQLVLGTATR